MKTQEIQEIIQIFKFHILKLIFKKEDEAETTEEHGRI